MGSIFPDEWLSFNSSADKVLFLLNALLFENSKSKLAFFADLNLFITGYPWNWKAVVVINGFWKIPWLTFFLIIFFWFSCLKFNRNFHFLEIEIANGNNACTLVDSGTHFLWSKPTQYQYFQALFSSLVGRLLLQNRFLFLGRNGQGLTCLCSASGYFLLLSIFFVLLLFGISSYMGG